MNPSDSTYNILIVEDNITVSKLISNTLRKNKQYIIQRTDKIKWARRLTNKIHFDLICLDIILPDGNGIDFCKELKDNHEHKNTKIIMISKKTEVDKKVKAFETGADEYLPKPFHPHELEIRIKKHLGLINKEKFKIKYKELMLDSANLKFLYEKYELPLTRNEFLVLKYIFENRGFAKTEILAKLLSSKNLRSVSNQSVIVSINRLRKKLERNTGNHFIKTRYGRGYYIP